MCACKEGSHRWSLCAAFISLLLLYSTRVYHYGALAIAEVIVLVIGNRRIRDNKTALFSPALFSAALFSAALFKKITLLCIVNYLISSFIAFLLHLLQYVPKHRCTFLSHFLKNMLVKYIFREWKIEQQLMSAALPLKNYFHRYCTRCFPEEKTQGLLTTASLNSL